MKINKYPSVPSGFFDFSGLGFFFYINTSYPRTQLIYNILIKNKIFLLTLQLHERNQNV